MNEGICVSLPRSPEAAEISEAAYFNSEAGPTYKLQLQITISIIQRIRYPLARSP